MDASAAKMIGAGIAAIGILGGGIGIGLLFQGFLSAAIRNPGAAAKQTGNLFVGAAFAEATSLFALVVALLVLFS